MIALSALLAGQFNRRGNANRLLGAVTVVVVVQAASLGVANLATASLAIIPAMYALPVVAILASLVVLLRGPRRRHRSAVLT